jgi:hypothetical protein
MLQHLLVSGGFGGDIDWGIHKWDEYTQEDYGIGRFDGYRFYVGEREHGIRERGDIEEFTSEEHLKELLGSMLKAHIKEGAINEDEAKRWADRFSIKL